jgi:hypothetical protein
MKKINLKHPREFEFLIKEILYILDSEQDSKYYLEEGKQEKHEVEKKLTLYKLDRSKIKLVENLSSILQFADDLIKFLKCKYEKFPDGYHYYINVAKRMANYVKILLPYQAENDK